MENEHSVAHLTSGGGTVKSYVIGFILSLILTMTSYFLVTEKVIEGWPLFFTISGLAIAQAIVQLIFFLHMAAERAPYWNLITFIFMLMVLLIVVIGTLWIMYNLDYRMM